MSFIVVKMFPTVAFFGQKYSQQILALIDVFESVIDVLQQGFLSSFVNLVQIVRNIFEDNHHLT